MAPRKKYYKKKRAYRGKGKKQGYNRMFSNAPDVKVGRGFQGDYNRSQAEKKFVDVGVATYALDTTGTVTLLNGCADGSTVNTRIGRKTCIKSVQVRGVLLPQDAWASGAQCDPCLARVMLVWDKQANGAAFTIANLLSAATAASFNNLDNRERFVVLMDKHFAFGMWALSTAAGAAFAAVDKTVAIVNKYKRMPKDAFTIFSGTGATIASINTGALFLVTIGTNAAGNGWNANLVTRVRYTDA